jgi:hypothetical protein
VYKKQLTIKYKFGVDGPSDRESSKMSNTNPNTGHSGHNILSNLIHSINYPTSLASSLSSSSTSTLTPMSNDGASTSGFNNSASRQQQPLLQGLLHKLHNDKNKRQKYFVIFDDEPNRPGTARLEYFDNEKKFKQAMQKNPDHGITNQKRSIILSKCFNINQRTDLQKYGFVIGLYRKDDKFSIIMKDKQEMDKWLRQLLILHRGKEVLDGEQPKPKYGKFNSFFFLLYEKYMRSILIGSKFANQTHITKKAKQENKPARL